MSVYYVPCMQIDCIQVSYFVTNFHARLSKVAWLCFQLTRGVTIETLCHVTLKWLLTRCKLPASSAVISVISIKIIGVKSTTTLLNTYRQQFSINAVALKTQLYNIIHIEQSNNSASVFRIKISYLEDAEN